jgi:ATP-binding cassette subfamily B protein
LQVVLVILLLGSVDKVLALLPLVAALSVLTVRKGQSRLQQAYEKAAPLRRQSNHYYEVATAAASADEVRALRLGRTIIGQFNDAWSKVDTMQRRVETRATVETMAGAVLLAAAYIGAISLVVSEGIRGARSPGDVLLTVIVAGVINQQMVTILDSTNRLLIAMHAVGRFLWLVDYADAARPPEATAELPARLRQGIAFEHVSFSYPGTEREVLHDVSLELPAGSIVALVGDNGAGKTTLVKLLGAMYAPTDGRIAVDEIDLSSYDVDLWRARLAAAFQDYARFELLLQEAVGIGDLPWLADELRVNSALERAGASDLVSQLEDGLSTPLGPSFEHGTNLSGGQWQKVSLGRAMMRMNPLLLIMDEPTANLDPVAERALFERYVDRARGLTSDLGTIVVFVTHRFSSVRIADFIVVLGAGRVVEMGSHEALLGSGGVYAELYQLQAGQYM